MVARVLSLLPLLPLVTSFHGYTLTARLLDACCPPVQAYAAHRGDGRPFCIYCVEANEVTAAGRERFLAHVAQLREIEHERIPRVVEGGLDDVLLWVAIETIEASSLSDRIMEGAPLDPMHVVMMLRDAIAPLRIARDAGVLHGRLAPRHLLTTAAECRAVLEIGFYLLFGPSDEDHDVAFRAPEQLDPKGEADERADIYALGAIAYFALGSPLFEDTGHVYDMDRVRRRILIEDLPPLSRVRLDCPLELETLLRALCAKRKEDRPRSYELLEPLLTRALAACVAHRKGERLMPVASESAAPVAVASESAAPVAVASESAAPVAVAPESAALVAVAPESAAPVAVAPDASPSVHQEPAGVTPDDEARPADHNAVRPLVTPQAPPADGGVHHRSDLRIAAVAVGALAFVAIITSFGACLLAWKTEPPSSSFRAPVPPTLTSLPTVEAAAPPPVVSPPPPVCEAHPATKGTVVVRIAPLWPSTKAAPAKLSAIQERARGMRYHLEDR